MSLQVSALFLGAVRIYLNVFLDKTNKVRLLEKSLFQPTKVTFQIFSWLRMPKCLRMVSAQFSRGQQRCFEEVACNFVSYATGWLTLLVGLRYRLALHYW